MNLYQYARRYVDIGWSVIPVNEDKTPAVAQVVPFRTERASDAQLHEWFDKGDKGIAVITGELSGIIVIDDDSAKKSGVPDEIIKKTSSSVMSQTATGGKHFFLKYEKGYGNKVNLQGKNIDIRSEGGYVVIPPTVRTINGKKVSYEWLSKPSPENLKKMPKLSATQHLDAAVKTQAHVSLDPNDYLFLGEGGRDDGLHRLALSFLHKNPKNWVYDTIKSIAKNYDPPLPERDVDRIFKSAVRKYEEDKRLRAKMPKDIKKIISDRMKERENEEVAPSTGYRGLDKLIHGFIPSNLYTLTGDTNAGKTIMACNFAVAVAEQKKKVLYIALETGNRIIEVMASVRTGKSYADLTADDLNNDSGNIDYFVDNDIESVEDLERTIRELDQHYDLIVIDHIGYFVSSTENYLREQANILKKLRSLTKERHTAILIIAHLRKRPNEASRKKNFVPTADDIAGSASFKQDSTDVMIIIREKDELDTHHLKVTPHGWLYVVKTKNGTSGAVDLRFHDVDLYNKSAKVEEMEKVYG